MSFSDLKRYCTQNKHKTKYEKVIFTLAESLNVTSIDSATVKRFRAFTLFLMIRESNTEAIDFEVYFLLLRESMIAM